MNFEEITKETLYIALEIMNSNPQFNEMENRKKTRSLTDMEKEFLSQNSTSEFININWSTKTCTSVLSSLFFLIKDSAIIKSVLTESSLFKSCKDMSPFNN